MNVDAITLEIRSLSDILQDDKVKFGDEIPTSVEVFKDHIVVNTCILKVCECGKHDKHIVSSRRKRTAFFDDLILMNETIKRIREGKA